MIKSFELQTYHDGQWMIQGIFSDSGLAIMEANRCLECNRFVGVRVREESWNGQPGPPRVRTIFSAGPGVELDRSGLQMQIAERANQARLLRQYDEKPSAAPGAGAAPRRGRMRWALPFLLLILLGLGGIAAMAGLQSYFMPNQRLIVKF